MYLRRPLVQRGSPRRRLSRWSAASSPNTTTTPSDFDRYVQSECTDVVFASEPASSSAATSSPVVSSDVSTSRCLHSGPEVAALPATTALFHHANAPLWLPVLTCLHHRSALTSRDGAGAMRHLPAFTYRPLLPWLWMAGAASTSPASLRLVEDYDVQTSRNPAGGVMKSRYSDGAAAAAPAAVAGEAGDVTMEVYNNLSLVAMERARQLPVKATALCVQTAAELNTVEPHLWLPMAKAFVATLSPSATRAERRKKWQDVLFVLRSHAIWNTTTTELREVAHPQLLRVLDAFYADMHTSHDGGSNEEKAMVMDLNQGQGNDDAVDLGEEAEGEPTVSLHAPRYDVVGPLRVETLTPPLVLRNFRTLYRRHAHSAMLFAELYTFCVEQEERSVRCAIRPTATPPPTSSTVSPSFSSSASPLRALRVLHVSTTALLMDVDLAVYFASLPGRRNSGIATPAEQWALTLQHLRFLLPRLHALQQCRRAPNAPSKTVPASASPSPAIADGELWEPWRRVATVLMNVCVWVENNNAEASRCCEALRHVVLALHELCNVLPSPHHHVAGKEARDGKRHALALLGTPTVRDVRQYVTTLVEAARDSMRAKAQQLHYGPTDGLFGIYLLSVATAAVLPSPHTQQQQQQQPNSTSPEALSSSSFGGDSAKETPQEAAAALLAQLQLFVHEAKTTPQLVWAALRGTSHLDDAARYGLVTVGSHLFSECVMPLAQSSATTSTAQRLFACLCAWGTEVGRPLGLSGPQVAALWQLRWLQKQQQHGSSSAMPHMLRTTMMKQLNAALSTHSGGRRRVAAAATPHSSHGRHPSHPQHRPHDQPRGEWTCGCGFRNVHDTAANALMSLHDASSTPACVACVLRDLVPHTWECPSCHSVSRSGVAVPYCLHCGEVHPALPANAAVTDIDSCSFLHVCSACHAVTPTTLPSVSAATIDYTLRATGVAATTAEEPTSPSASCASCGRDDTCFYTAVFSWTCGCGAENSPERPYCHACSRAAHVTTYTCPQCQHTQSDVRQEGGCARCHYPHPRQLALTQQHRLAHCPACQGLVDAACHVCPHCTSSAVGAVVALLPTLADQPRLCLHCGALHPVRDNVTGQLRGPPQLRQRRAYVRKVEEISQATGSALRVEVPIDGGVALLGDGDARCTHCGTHRVSPAAWEPNRLWSCAQCGEAYNTEAACRRCCALHPAVPAATVFVWRCGHCQRDHPSWETTCTTPGCGGRRVDAAVFHHDESHLDHTIGNNSGNSQCQHFNSPSSEVDGSTSDGTSMRFCYSPWECAECGAVTLSSHMPCCSSCGAAVPAEVATALCTSVDCVKTTADNAAVANTTVVAEHAAVERSPTTHRAALHRRPDPVQRLAEVEEFLLRAADTDAPLLNVVATASSAMRTMMVMPATATLNPTTVHDVARVAREEDSTCTAKSSLLWPLAAEGRHRQAPATPLHASTAAAGEQTSEVEGGETWEDAYRAAVMSF